MRTIRKFAFGLLVLLGNTAGIPKVLRLEDEVEFFAGVGLDENALVAFGVVQIIAGLLLFPKKTRVWGAGILALTFLGSTIMIFASGQTAFGVVSILPILLAVNVVEQHARRRTLKGPAKKADS